MNLWVQYFLIVLTDACFVCSAEGGLGRARAASRWACRFAQNLLVFDRTPKLVLPLQYSCKRRFHRREERGQCVLYFGYEYSTARVGLWHSMCHRTSNLKDDIHLLRDFSSVHMLFCMCCPV